VKHDLNFVLPSAGNYVGKNKNTFVKTVLRIRILTSIIGFCLDSNKINFLRVSNLCEVLKKEIFNAVKVLKQINCGLYIWNFFTCQITS
jgi:hypothetical protein